jgi:hypothetical protein
MQSQTAKHAADCMFTVASGQTVYGPYVRLPPGQYSVGFDLAVDSACRGGEAVLDVVTSANNFRPLVRQDQVISASGVQSLNFEIGLDLAGTADLEFRTALPRPSGDCLLLKHVVVTRH